MQQQTKYLEVIRYMQNAEETFQKVGNEFFKKYMQTATETAYIGVLLALDTFLKKIESNKYIKPTSIEDYKKRLAKVNKKALSTLNDIYSELNISDYYYYYYYYGVFSVNKLNDSFKKSYKIIEYIKE